MHSRFPALKTINPARDLGTRWMGAQARLPAAFLTRMELIDTFRVAFAARLRAHCAPNSRPRRLARPRTPPFHGDNTGSNPVGDAKKQQFVLHAALGARRTNPVWGDPRLRHLHRSTAPTKREPSSPPDCACAKMPGAPSESLRLIMIFGHARILTLDWHPSQSFRKQGKRRRRRQNECYRQCRSDECSKRD